jgi:hypothetical protein
MGTARLSVAATTALTAAPVIWLTTLRPDGSPHVTPTWFVADDEQRLWLVSARTNGEPRPQACSWRRAYRARASS